MAVLYFSGEKSIFILILRSARGVVYRWMTPGYPVTFGTKLLL